MQVAGMWIAYIIFQSIWLFLSWYFMYPRIRVGMFLLIEQIDRGNVLLNTLMHLTIVY